MNNDENSKKETLDELISEINNEIGKFKNADINKAIKLFKEKTAKECYKIELIEEEPEILDNKIGGKPYLPIGEDYPTDKYGNNLALLLQVNLKDIDLLGYPKNGILEIFTDRNVDYPCEYAIRYFKEGLEYQRELPDINLDDYIVDRAYKISLKKDICYMPLNDYRFSDTFKGIVNDLYNVNLENYNDLVDFFGSSVWYDAIETQINNPKILIGGYADFTQDDPRNYNVKNKDECLFKLDSDADYNKIRIGDSGILFTLISQSDIEKCNFHNALVDWDCC